MLEHMRKSSKKLSTVLYITRMKFCVFLSLREEEFTKEVTIELLFIAE